MTKLPIIVYFLIFITREVSQKSRASQQQDIFQHRSAVAKISTVTAN